MNSLKICILRNTTDIMGHNVDSFIYYKCLVELNTCASRDVTRTINLDILNVIREHDYYEL